jgi:hypothetical protein
VASKPRWIFTSGRVARRNGGDFFVPLSLTTVVQITHGSRQSSFSAMTRVFPMQPAAVVMTGSATAAGSQPIATEA